MSRVLISKSVTPRLYPIHKWSVKIHKFCDDYKILEQFHMPASEALLTVFVTCRATGSVSSSTLRHWLLSLELWHEINGAPWLTIQP